MSYLYKIYIVSEPVVIFKQIQDHNYILNLKLLFGFAYI